MFWNNEKKRQKLFPSIRDEQQSMIGNKLSFAASEAYKLLRTNIMFSFTDDESKRIIGVTSSFKGEGKSLTAINLAYTIAETGKRVLLMECDLRLPNIAKRLKLHTKPGLSNLLVGLNSADEAVQKGVMLQTLDVMPAGDIPPNASELLESGRMKYVLDKLTEYYDYILLDLPPVGDVSDAIVVSKLTSGMVIVVRQNYAGKAALAKTMRQMKYVDAKILGFVFNSADETTSPYRKHYYKTYGYDKKGTQP